MQDLQKPLAQNTTLVETIKADVEHRDWAARTWKQVRIERLEALMADAEGLVVELDSRRNRAIIGQLYEGPDHLGRIEGITSLYFPELTQATQGLYAAASRVVRLCFDAARGVVDAGNNPEIVRQVLHTLGWRVDEEYPPFLQARTKPQRQAGETLVGIFGVAASE